MDTLISKIDVDNIDMEEIKKQAEILRAGETVIFPTETVYGLGANALDEEAVSKIYKAKGRPSDNPLIVHIGDKKQVYNLVQSVTKEAEIVMDKLKELDPVAYVRFASVYREFKDVNTFMDELKKILDNQGE